MSELLEELIGGWLSSIAERNTIPSPVKALYIGMFEGEQNYMLYLTGSCNYDPNDIGSACGRDWWPEPRYLDSGIPIETTVWSAFLESALAALNTLEAERKAPLLGTSLPVFAGFDDGDLVAVV